MVQIQSGWIKTKLSPRSCLEAVFFSAGNWIQLDTLTSYRLASQFVFFIVVNANDAVIRIGTAKVSTSLLE